MTPIDEVALRFDAASLTALNAILGLIMFGVALDLRLDDFRRVAAAGRGAVLGLGAQFVALPAVTYLLVRVVEPAPSLALGMMLVAACPGGNISNFMTHFARGSTALSVSLSAVSTAAAAVMTPLNLALWGSLYPPTHDLLRRVALEPVDLLLTIAVLLGVPLVAGMALAYHRPRVALRLRGPLRVASLVFFGLFVAVALAANFRAFLAHVGAIAGVVCAHNALALGLGYGAACLVGLGEADRRAVAIEIGIQNSGLGLVLVFDFFDGLGGMAVVTAWWGVWHIVSGLSLATFWSRRPPREAPLEATA